ncbi:hypothetical protein M0R45_030762 [Rubus argutus]|uniref:Uncharacterized protein n=1 Tax=Rubus argutus TaxID=59490 RepID=A0AAW1WG26_RUBAR
MAHGGAAAGHERRSVTVELLDSRQRIEGLGRGWALAKWVDIGIEVWTAAEIDQRRWFTGWFGFGIGDGREWMNWWLGRVGLVVQFVGMDEGYVVDCEGLAWAKIDGDGSVVIDDLRSRRK